VQVLTRPIDPGQSAAEARVAPRLADHELWLDSGGKSGNRAVFRDEHLTGFGKLFKRRDLRKIRFADVDLDETPLFDSDLRGVDLTLAHNLTPDQFAGANLRNAKLPEKIDFAVGLNSVEQVAKAAAQILTSLLIACAYSWLTIASTKDAELLSNRATSSLPIIGVTIPIVSFYLAAPIVLLGVFVYFCLQLHRVWIELSTLPAIFPDGVSLDRKSFPTPWTSFVSIAFLRLNSSSRGRAQLFASAFITWGIVPINLLHIWAKYLRCHDVNGTTEHILCIVLSVYVGLNSFTLCLQRLKTHTAVPRPISPIALLAGAALTVCLMCFTFAGFRGGPTDLYSTPRTEWDTRAAHLPWTRTDYRAWAPQLLSLVPGANPFAELMDADVSIAPPGWVGTGPNDLARVRGAQLGHRDLRFMNGTRAFMVSTSFLHSDLYGVNLWHADLRGCDLTGARADNSIFYQADLRYATLTSTSLVQSDMRTALLQEADMTGANLQDARLDEAVCFHTTFTGTNLTRTSFYRANLQSAVFNGVTFDPKAIRAAHNWVLARYWDTKAGTGTDTLTKIMGLPEYHNVTISNHNLKGYDLRGQDLTRADLTDYNLTGARLDGAQLSKAILSEARGLTVDQLAAAKIDYMTRLPTHPPITLEQVEQARQKRDRGSRTNRKGVK